MSFARSTRGCLAALAATVVVATLSSTAVADANSCDDYLSRHYRKDLVVTKIRYQDREYMGDIRFPHQAVWLTVKNRGEKDFRRVDGQQYRNLRVRVGSAPSITARVSMPLASGQSTVVRFSVRPGTLRNCRMAEVRIDSNHQFGQWGCNVWNNDRKTLRAQLASTRFCRAIPHPVPRPNPRPWPRPLP